MTERGLAIDDWSLVIGHSGLVIPLSVSPLYNLHHTGSFELKEPAVFRVTREIDFCYGHRLLNYDGKCRYLHGHNGQAVIAIEAESLDDRGMVLDFSDIKKVVSTWIDENLDHRMILNRTDPMVAVLEEMGEPMYLLDANPTAENIAKLIHDCALQNGFPIVETRLWETPRCFATYRGS